MKVAVSLVFILLSVSLISQVNESDTTYFRSPKKATILSLVLPGAGQVYNHKYWKLPIVYGGLGLSAYYLHRNLEDIRFYKKNLIALQDDDPNTINTSGLDSSTLIDVVDQRKNWRDLSYLAIGVVYVLQVLDANVDAHLYYFDVDRDLSLIVLPYMDPSTGTTAGLSLSLNF